MSLSSMFMYLFIYLFIDWICNVLLRRPLKNFMLALVKFNGLSLATCHYHAAQIQKRRQACDSYVIKFSWWIRPRARFMDPSLWLLSWQSLQNKLPPPPTPLPPLLFAPSNKQTDLNASSFELFFFTFSVLWQCEHIYLRRGRLRGKLGLFVSKYRY